MSGGVFVGVDGGGTHTRAVVGRVGGEVVASGEAGASNPSALGFDVAVAAIEAAVRAAMGGAGVERVAGMALGVAGAGRPADRARLEARLRGLDGFPERVVVVQDVALLLPAAGLASGIAIVAGTGSSTFGVGPDGRTGTAGGWGYLLGDEGSAYAVGRAALRAVGHAADGHGAATALTELVSAQLGLAQPRDLITAVYQSASPRTTIAELAPVVAAAARDGDAVARSILEENGRDLAVAAVALARRLGLADGAPVVGVGGMLGAGAAFRGALDEELVGGGLARLVELAHEPVVGALRLATGEVAVPGLD